MFKIKWAFFFILLCFSALAFARPVYRPSSDTVGEKAYEIEYEARYFTQTATFDVDGAEVAQEEGQSFSLFDNDLTFRYGYGERLEFRVGGRFRQVQSEINENSNSNTGPESFWLGAKYQFKPLDHWHYAVDFQFRQTTYTNKEYASISDVPVDEINLGNDGNAFTVTGHLSYRRTKSHYLAASLGYNKPPNEMSPELPYHIESAWVFNRWAWRLGIEGIYSLGLDQFSDNPNDKPLEATGATAQFNSINREILAPYLAASYAFRTWRIGLKALHIYQGKSTDRGNQLSLNLMWRFGGEDMEEKKIRQFKEYDIEATIIKISPRGKFVKIDQGLGGDVEKGMRFDIYKTDFFGGNILVASGRVYELGADWAIVKLEKIYVQTEIKNGFVARGY